MNHMNGETKDAIDYRERHLRYKKGIVCCHSLPNFSHVSKKQAFS